MSECKFYVRYNVLPVSGLESFAHIRGGFHGNCRDVYFIRAVGAYPGLEKDVEKVDAELAGRMFAGQCRYYRADRFPALSASEEIRRYTKSYEEWKAGGKRAVGIPAAASNAELGKVLGKACETVLALFRRENPNANETIERNFAVKLLYWFNRIGKGLTEAWEPGASMKVVFENITRKQEYFFCYLLTQMGIDVLLLQYQSDIGEELERLNLSRKIVLGTMANCAIPAYDASGYQRAGAAKNARPGSERENETYSPAGGMESRSARPVVHLPERRRKNPAGAGHTEQTSVYGSPVSGSGGYTAGRPSAAPLETASRPMHLSERPRGIEKRELDFEELARFASSVVMIVIHDQNGKVRGSGSGIMIGQDGYILTNNHVASGGRFYSVRIEEDEQVYTTDEVIKYNSVLDLAVLRIRRKLKPIPVYAGRKGLVRGQRVVAIGSPLGLFNSVSDGIISGFRKVDGVDMIQFTAPISHGSSGGAVLNMYGEVIGISTAGVDSGQNINLAVGYECIHPFIRGLV